MKRSIGPPIASAAATPNSVSAARLKRTMRSSPSIVMTPSVTASTSLVIRSSPWRSAACIVSRSLMSKKVATAPCTRPACTTGCDQYSTGNTEPSRRQNRLSATCSSWRSRLARCIDPAPGATCCPAAGVGWISS